MDAVHALDHLTEDCWREVFKKVWSPADLKSCSETCTTFEGILERKKNTWMFPAILPHVLKYLPSPARHGSNFNRRFHHFNNWNAMYTCRRVCQGWREAVDHYLETHNSYFEEIAKPTFHYWFIPRESTEQFWQMFEDFTGNPFIGRFINFYRIGLLNPPQVGQPNQNQDDYLVNLRQILNRFGNEIWSLSTQYQYWLGQLTFCKNIQILLSMLPNLKNLQLSRGGEHAYIFCGRSRQDPEMNQLPAFLAANPLPDHPNLENLVLDAVPFGMTRPLLEKYGPQLKRLQSGDPKRFAEKVGRFQCLKHLDIWVFNANESLKALRKLRSPLNILHVHVKCDDISSTWPIHELIQNVLHLPVTDLWISSWNPFENKKGAFPATLRHGSVQRIKIASYTRSSLSCNFLRCFPNLEEIHFQLPHGGILKPGPSNNLLIIKSSEDDMYESAVWDVLPHLQLITVNERYSRPAIQNEYRRSTLEKRRLDETKEILAVLF